jgi:nucleotide-binding universal stress UspA family protein
MNSVLIAIDTDEKRALSQAKEVANLFGEQFNAHLLHVFQENSEGATISNLVTARRVEDFLSNEGIDVTLHERSGDPAPQIVNIASDIDADLISIAGRKRSPTGKVLFGSVAQDVILSTRRSVLVCDTISD